MKYLNTSRSQTERLGAYESDRLGSDHESQVLHANFAESG
jgi:hypothetical protein